MNKLVFGVGYLFFILLYQKNQLYFILLIRFHNHSFTRLRINMTSFSFCGWRKGLQAVKSFACSQISNTICQYFIEKPSMRLERAHQNLPWPRRDFRLRTSGLCTCHRLPRGGDPRLMWGNMETLWGLYQKLESKWWGKCGNLDL